MSNILRYVFVVMMLFGLFFIYDGSLVTGTPGGSGGMTSGTSTSVITTTSGGTVTTITTTVLVASDTTTAVSCSPGIIGTSTPATCTAMITPALLTSTGYNPTGTVSWSASGGGLSLSSSSCIVSGSGCSITVTLTGHSTGSTIRATYSGNQNDRSSSGIFQLGVVSSTPVTISVNGGGSPGQAFSFSASSSCSSAVYTWDFGDGSISEGSGVTHVYTSAGSFIVVVSMNSATGCFGSAQTTVQAAAPSVTELQVHVLTAATNSPVAGATVFVSGNPQKTTDSSGNAVFALLPGNYQVTVNANGFEQWVLTVTVTASGLTLPVFLNLPYCSSACPQSIFGTGPAAAASEMLVGIAMLIGGGVGFFISSKKPKVGL